jgi:hypothetical protein
LVMVGLLQGVGDIEHRQPAMTDPPQANLQNSPDTTAVLPRMRLFRSCCSRIASAPYLTRLRALASA